jgi:hypothetical protein
MLAKAARRRGRQRQAGRAEGFVHDGRPRALARNEATSPRPAQGRHEPHEPRCGDGSDHERSHERQSVIDRRLSGDARFLESM